MVVSRPAVHRAGLAQEFPAGTSRIGGSRRLRRVPEEGRYTLRADEETIMSAEVSKAIVGRWFTGFGGG